MMTHYDLCVFCRQSAQLCCGHDHTPGYRCEVPGCWQRVNAAQTWDTA